MIEIGIEGWIAEEADGGAVPVSILHAGQHLVKHCSPYGRHQPLANRSGQVWSRSLAQNI